MYEVTLKISASQLEPGDVIIHPKYNEADLTISEIKKAVSFLRFCHPIP